MQTSDWFQGEKLEILHYLTQQDKDEIQQMLIIMTYMDEMIDNGIIDVDDFNDFGNLSKKKQREIKDFISNKIASQIERNNNGNKEQKEKEL